MILRNCRAFFSVRSHSKNQSTFALTFLLTSYYITVWYICCLNVQAVEDYLLNFTKLVVMLNIIHVYEKNHPVIRWVQNRGNVFNGSMRN